MKAISQAVLFTVGALFSTSTAEEIKVSLFLPMSDGTTGRTSCESGKKLHDSTCYWINGGEMALAASALLAVDEFNGRSATYVPAFGELVSCPHKLNVTVYDSGSTAAVSIRNLLDALKLNPDAIIGTDTSGSCLPTSIITGALDIPQISYWATSQGLDDVNSFPRFMRTIPTDDDVARAICKYWRSQGYKQAAMLYINDEYGEAYKKSLLRHCEIEGMEKVHAFPFIDDDDQMRAQVSYMAKTGVRVILLVTVKKGFQTIVDQAYKLGIFGNGSSWVFSDGVSTALLESLEGDLRKAASGSLRVISTGGIDSNPRWTAFREKWESNEVNRVNEYLPTYWQLPPTLYKSLPADSLEVKDVGTFAFDAMAAIGIAACKFGLQKGFGTRLWNGKGTLTFDGISGKVKFDSIGNRESSTGNFQLTNIILKENSIESVPLGVFDQSVGEWQMMKDIVYNGDSSEEVNDVVPPYHDLKRLGDFKIFSYVLFGINFLLSLGLLLWTFDNRNHIVVKASQTKFLMLVAVGVMISSSAILPISVDDADAPLDLYNMSSTTLILDGEYYFANAACIASVVLYSIGFTITYSSLASKIWRIKKIFKNKKMKKVIISNQQLFGIMAWCMFCDAVILGLWQAISPLQYQREVIRSDEFFNPLESTGQCVSKDSTLFLSLIGAYHIILLLLGSIFSYQCRNVSTALNEGKYVGVAVVSNLQVLAIAIPVLIIVADNPASTMFLRSGVVFLNDISVLLLVFVPKILAVRSNKSFHSLFKTSSQLEGSELATGTYSKNPTQFPDTTHESVL